MVAKALKNGEIQKEPCEKCGNIDAHAHHDDYNKPLEIRWLCRDHHMQEHGLSRP